MRFYEALKEVIEDKKAMRLEHWPLGTSVKAQYPDDHSKMKTPYLYIERRCGGAPWTPLPAEVFSIAWETR